LVGALYYSLTEDTKSMETEEEESESTETVGKVEIETISSEFLDLMDSLIIESEEEAD
jgi:hypothetical protein